MENIENLINKIKHQAPENVSEEEIKKQIEIHNGDFVKILTELWNINYVKNTDIDENKQKWDNIREICSSYEMEMYNLMQNSKKT